MLNKPLISLSNCWWSGMSIYLCSVRTVYTSSCMHGSVHVEGTTAVHNAEPASER